MSNLNLFDLFAPTPALNSADCVAALRTVQNEMRDENRTLSFHEIHLLMLQLENRDINIREECLLTLNDCSRETGRMASLIVLLDEEWLLRDRALEELEFTGGPQDQYAVERVLLTEPEWTVRASAVSCLAGIAGEKAKPTLTKALGDENAHVRRYAAIALARVGSAEDRAALLEAAAVENEDEARVGIFSALYRLGSAEYLHKLLDLADKPSPYAGLQILVLGTLENFLFPGDRETVYAYLKTIDLKKAHAEVRERAQRLLTRFDQPDTIDKPV